MIVLRYAYAIALAVDLLASALTGGAPLETLSARFGRARNNRDYMGTIAANAIDWSARVLFRQRHHCELALLAYEARNSAASAWSG